SPERRRPRGRETKACPGRTRPAPAAARPALLRAAGGRESCAWGIGSPEGYGEVSETGGDYAKGRGRGQRQFPAASRLTAGAGEGPLPEALPAVPARRAGAGVRLAQARVTPRRTSGCATGCSPARAAPSPSKTSPLRVRGIGLPPLTITTALTVG